MKQVVLALDLGGTNLRVAAVDSDGRILHRTRRETPQAERAEEIVSAISEAARDCLNNVSASVKALAAAVPATVDFENGITIKLPNVPALNNYRLAAALEKELDLPCFLENDANAAAIGENWLGAAKDLKNFILLTLGTGIGGGIFIDGKIYRGADGTAGEIGHICVEPFGAPCGCGSRGCVEQYASASAMVRIAGELKSRFPESQLTKTTQLSASEIYESAKNGDNLALEVFRLQGFYLGILLAGLINIFNPEAFVFGGGAASGWDLFISHAQEQIRQRAYREPAERAKLFRAELGDDAGILGAARVALDR